MSPIGGITLGAVSERVEFNQRMNRTPESSQSVASTFRWMVLTVWVVKGSGIGWRGGEARGESPRRKSQRLVMVLVGKNEGNRRMRFW